MKSAALFTVTALLASTPVGAVTAKTLETLFELSLDLDGNGTADRIALVGGAGSDHNVVADGSTKRLSITESPSLYVYYNIGDDRLDLSRKPDALKEEITDSGSTFLYAPESKGPGAFVITSADGLHGNFVEEKITIAYRDHALWIAGYERTWEVAWRQSERVDVSYGRCDINFLTGKGASARGLNGKRAPINRHISRIELARWNAAALPAECRI